MNTFLSNPEEEAKEYLPRYKLLYFAVAIVTVLVVSRLWYLQVIQGTELRRFSEKNRVKETKIPAPRGLMLDRNGKVLVDNLPGFEASISPQYATHLEETAQAVGEVLEIPPSRIVQDVKRSRYRNGPFQPVKIKDNLSLDQVYALKMLRWDHPGLNINETILRHYPLGAAASQVLGYVGEISKEQLERLNKDLKEDEAFEQGDIIGKAGLEEIWDQDIRGTDGVSFVEVDARGREAATETAAFLGFQPIEAVPGSNLVLTLDRDLQEVTFKAMHRNDALKDRVGGVVVMKSNGEILAWVNTPSYDPNEFATGISATLWSKLVNDPFKPLRDKVIQDHFSPGSTFKPVVALAALQEHVITPTTYVYAPGFIKFGRRIYHDHNRGGEGNVTVYDALERSSNVFFYKMGIALGIDRMASYAKGLGLGSRTGIGLDNEVPGLIPTSEWKLKAIGEEWQPGENLSNAIGQGFVLTTALQMAVAYNAIGLGGKIYKPHLISRLMSQDNKVLKEFHPQLIRDLSDPKSVPHIDAKNFEVVREGLRRVMNGQHGTGRFWHIPGVEMAGKTGTSQVMSFAADQIYKDCPSRPIQQRHHGWFVVFAPAENPEITVAVLAEHACHGNMGGAPVARDIIEAYFKKYRPELLKVDPKLAKKAGGSIELNEGE
jgi:penicillin-binding protein 2